MKAAQEYSGKNERLVALGIEANACGEARLLHLCKQAGFAKPAALARQLHLILQGALVLAHARGESTPFSWAKEAVAVLLDNAAAA
jgi:hypothetical protein